MDPTASRDSVLTVKALAERVGLRPDTVRYDERVGLLAPPHRSPAGYRRYPEAAVDRVRFIQGAKRLGLRLADIRELLAVRDTGQCPCGPAEAMLARRLDEIEREMTRLAALRTDLTRMLTAIPDATCPDPAPGTWQPTQNPHERR